MIIGIVADDLTGAADSVAPFAARGLTADVQWAALGKMAADLAESDARAWCTGSRDMAASREFAIRRLTRAAARRLLRFSPRILYKKIDSTLRGHLWIELDAMRAEIPGRLAVVCPAFPANGRVVRNGVLYVHGEGRQSVRAAFGMGGDPSAIELTLDTLRSAPDSLAERCEEWIAEGNHTVFCDAETDADLDAIAAAVLELGERCLPVGSAGLSRAIAARTPEGSPNTEALITSRRDLSRRRVLVIVGSLHAATRRQAARLAEQAGISPIVTPVQGDRPGLTREDMVKLEAIPMEIKRKFESGDRIVLVKTPDIESGEVSDAIGADAYSRYLWLVGMPRAVDLAQSLVITGGHTAQQLVQGLGDWGGISILGEAEPGVVVGRIRGSGEFGAKMDGRPIVLKSGGFGDDDTLVRCVMP